MNIRSSRPLLVPFFSLLLEVGALDFFEKCEEEEDEHEEPRGQGLELGLGLRVRVQCLEF